MKILENNSITPKLKASEKPKLEFHIESVKEKSLKEPEERHCVNDKTQNDSDELFDNFDDLRLK